MVEIIQNSKYNARAMQKADIKNKIPGYNFAYPVLNTIEITNLFINGGPIDITIERSGLLTWSFDTQTETLIIAQDNKQERHIIKNIEDLVEAMNKYFDENKDVLMKDNLATNMKKSNSKIGNQNAKCNKSQNELDEKEIEEFKLYKLANGRHICTLKEYVDGMHKSPREYLEWVKAKKCVFCIDPNSRQELEELGYDINDLKEKERQEMSGYKTF